MPAYVPFLVFAAFIGLFLTIIIMSFKAAYREDKRINRMIRRRAYRTVDIKKDFRQGGR